METNGADLASSPQIQEWRRKKSLRRKISGSFFSFNFFPFLEPKFCSRFRGQRQYFAGAQATKCTSVVPGLLLSFGAQPSLGGHTSRLVGTISNGPIWGAHPRNALPLCRACSSVCTQLISKLCQGVLRFVLFYWSVFLNEIEFSQTEECNGWNEKCIDMAFKLFAGNLSHCLDYLIVNRVNGAKNFF